MLKCKIPYISLWSMLKPWLFNTIIIGIQTYQFYNVLSNIPIGAPLLQCQVLIPSVVKGVRNWIFFKNWLKNIWKFIYHCANILLLLYTWSWWKFSDDIARATGTRNWSIPWRGGGDWKIIFQASEWLIQYQKERVHDWTELAVTFIFQIVIQ